MGNRTRDLEERLARQDRPTPIVQMKAKQDDTHLLASRVLAGEINARQVPVHLREEVLAQTRVLHQAVVARTDETVRSLKEALTQANQTARTHSDGQGQALSEAERQRSTAHDLGRQTLALREELERLRRENGELEEQLRLAHMEAVERMSEMETLRAGEMGTSEGAL
ncbi:hypothetical protein HY631_04980, partial [Candidatus Uhrbacteria bacterium]|nr:hypothetical protein [Candidatus Uhrbacteria bacterium]